MDRGRLDDEVDKLLEAEMGRASPLPGAGFGARFAARRLKSQSVTAEVDFDDPAPAAFGAALMVIRAIGSLIGIDAPADPAVAVSDPGIVLRARAIIGAGYGNLNPAVVDVTVTATGLASCHLVAIATAKEGLVKQNTAEKAVGRLFEGLGLA